MPGDGGRSRVIMPCSWPLLKGAKAAPATMTTPLAAGMLMTGVAPPANPRSLGTVGDELGLKVQPCICPCTAICCWEGKSGLGESYWVAGSRCQCCLTAVSWDMWHQAGREIAFLLAQGLAAAAPLGGSHSMLVENLCFKHC